MFQVHGFEFMSMCLREFKQKCNVHNWRNFKNKKQFFWELVICNHQILISIWITLYLFLSRHWLLYNQDYPRFVNMCFQTDEPMLLKTQTCHAGISSGNKFRGITYSLRQIMNNTRCWFGCRMYID